MSKEHLPEPLDFFIWTVEDVGMWLEDINLGSYSQIFKEHGVNGEYLEGMSMFTTEQILRFIRQCHMKWGDFITLCKELRRIKGLSIYMRCSCGRKRISVYVACLKGEQKVHRPWWAPPCLSVVFVKVAKRNRQSRIVSLKLEQ
ncbi:SAM_2 domain-containing protein [Gossypium australe]|uniref:SAM_2 domain-containing protein n=1 Tax=Gossypium australe TaxID=47621 RepID=A0A5B6ULT3_9ROSI|nr:SAM_2 domain-containing protein [Gossypium australe]